MVSDRVRFFDDDMTNEAFVSGAQEIIAKAGLDQVELERRVYSGNVSCLLTFRGVYHFEIKIDDGFHGVDHYLGLVRRAVHFFYLKSQRK